MATKSMIDVAGTGAIRKALRGKSLKGRVKAGYSVMYEAPYAVYVHEDTQVHHDQGQAKYLEEPARTHAGQIGKIIKAELLVHRSIDKATLKGAEYLLEKSQELVPVDTGELRNSGKVVKEGE